MQTPRIVRAATSADLLKFVPTLTGVNPVESLVLVAFRGRRTAGALRLDLPPAGDEDERTIARWADRAVGTLIRLDGIDGVVAVVYTAATFAEHPEAPRRALLNSVRGCSRAAGLTVKDLLCVGGDAWSSVWDADATADARPLIDLVPDDASGLDDVRRTEAATRVPEHDEVVRDAFAERVEAWLLGEGTPPTVHGLPVDVGFRRRGRAARPGLVERALDGQDVVPFVEAALGEHPADTEDCDCRTLLAALLVMPVLRDVVMLQAAWGHRFARHVELHTIPAGIADPVDEAVLLAFTGGDFARPDGPRAERAARLLTDLAGRLPQPDRAPALTAAAWLHWSLGHGSAAGVLVEAALESDPVYGLAEIMAVRLARGDLPEWAFRDEPGTRVGRRWARERTGARA